MMKRKWRRSVQGAAPATANETSTDISIRKRLHLVNRKCDPILPIWDLQPGEYFFISTALRVDGSDKPIWHDEPFTRDRFHEVPAYVDAHYRTHDVYACVRGFTRPARREEYAAPTYFASADMDESDPRKLEGPLRPSIAIESSPGRYVGIWRYGQEVPSELNQRLTYHVGADKGGWGVTKVLRLIPGTINHKYSDEPRVRLLWDETNSRPPLAIAELEKLPPIRQPKTREPTLATCSADDRDMLVAHFASRIRGPFRSNVTNARCLCADKRSQVLFRHVCDLIEHGATDDQIFVIVEPCGFNKWAGDSDALRADIERIRAKGGADEKILSFPCKTPED